jgi:formylglycine-generating enzyme required for sulfatase activity
VSWYEAVAFCRWLTQKYRERGLLKNHGEIRLPTEAEWQQAATGGDPRRVYPWGTEWDSSRCNTQESNINRTTVVGLYPHGTWSGGPLDMAGNVWNWTDSWYDERKESRIIRGGSWVSDHGSARCANRYWNYPVNTYGLTGFRCARTF